MESAYKILPKVFTTKISNLLEAIFRATAAKYGQPTEWTHPHIIGPGEVNRGISKGEFHSRRDKLVEQLLR